MLASAQARDVKLEPARKSALTFVYHLAEGQPDSRHKENMPRWTVKLPGAREISLVVLGSFFNLSPQIRSPVAKLMLFASKPFRSEGRKEKPLGDFCSTQPLQEEQREL